MTHSNPSLNEDAVTSEVSRRAVLRRAILPIVIAVVAGLGYCVIRWSESRRDSDLRSRLVEAATLVNDADWSEAEVRLSAILDTARSGPRFQEAGARLADLLRVQGRIDEASKLSDRLMSDRSLESEELVEHIVRRWKTEFEPVPIDGLRSIVNDVVRRRPDDPRVRVALVHVLLRDGSHSGALAEVTDLLDDHPDDEVARRVFLEVVAATDRFDSLAGRSPTLIDSLPETARAEFLLRLISRRRSIESEAAQTGSNGRDDLTGLRDYFLSRSPAPSRLVEQWLLGTEADFRSFPIREFRDRQARFARSADRYRDLITRPHPEIRADELGRLALELGRESEYLAWAKIGGRSAHVPENPVNNVAQIPRIDVTAYWPKSGLVQGLKASLDANDDDAQDRLAVDLKQEAVKRGLDFRLDPGRTPQRQLPETMTGSLAVLDFDRDGHADIYCVAAGPLDAPPDARCADRLYRNRGDGTFEDISAQVGLSQLSGGYGTGVAIGDYDGDGWDDIFVSRLTHYQLLKNDGGKALSDRTEAAGLAGPRQWPSSSVFADIDQDGDFDLYVCHYVRWNTASPVICTDPASGARTYCDPKRLPHVPDRLFRNDGGRFTEISDASGITAIDSHGRGLGVIATDFNADGRTDFYVANDTTANFLLINMGQGRFENQADIAGVAGDGEGGYQASMGIACDDFSGDGLPDIIVTNFYGEGVVHYASIAEGQWADRSRNARLWAATRFSLGFGISAWNADNSLAPGLAIANGHVNDFSPHIPYRMPTQFFAWKKSRFEPYVLASDAQVKPRLGRALAVADFDSDGRQDILQANLDDSVDLFMNRTGGGQRLSLELLDRHGRRHPAGATVQVSIDGAVRRTIPVVRGGSYQTSPEQKLFVGLGSASSVDVTIRWPSGQTDKYPEMHAGEHRIVEK